MLNNKTTPLLLGWLLISAAIRPAHAVGPVAPQAPDPGLKHLPPFVLTFWCGPPPEMTSLQRYEQVRAAGFNVAMPACAGSTVADNLRILEAAHGAGLTAFVQDSRMPLHVTGDRDALAHVDQIVADYRGHPGLAGYFIADEPGASAFAGLGEVVAALRQRDPNHPAYINLFPNYATPDQLGAPTYEAYVEQFITTVHPSILSYDHYHFTTNGDGPLFFRNLEAIRGAALAHSLPFWNIVLLTTHGPYRNLDEGELRWEASQSLAYGARGVLYFTYWTPGEDAMNFRNGAISREGVETPHYKMVQAANRDTLAIGLALSGLQSTRVYHSGTVPAGGTSIPADAPLTPVGGDYTLGEFRDSRGGLSLLLANRDYRSAHEARLQTAAAVRGVEQYDLEARRWKRLRASGHVLSVSLPAGGSALFRLKTTRR